MARILVSPLNWGLGHATRDIPIIKELLRHGHEVTIAGEGRCVSLLKKEFPEAEHLRFPDYPSPYTASRHFLPKITSMLPKLFAAFKDERLRFEALQRKRKFDMVISDNRFGVAAKDAPSFFISHQLRYATPWYLPVETATAAFNARIFVWNAISSIALMITPIRREFSSIFFILPLNSNIPAESSSVLLLVSSILLPASLRVPVLFSIIA